MARSKGLTLPLIYNTGGYESVDVIRQLQNLVDIFLPDLKFLSDKLSWKYLRLRDYREAATSAILEMKRLVGDLQLGDDGVARRGLLVRHLVMPGMIEDAAEVYQWIARELGPETAVTINPRYIPEYRAFRHPEIARPTAPAEWQEAVCLAKKAGLRNILPIHVDVKPTLSSLATMVHRGAMTGE